MNPRERFVVTAGLFLMLGILGIVLALGGSAAPGFAGSLPTQAILPTLAPTDLPATAQQMLQQTPDLLPALSTASDTSPTPEHDTQPTAEPSAQPPAQQIIVRFAPQTTQAQRAAYLESVVAADGIITRQIDSLDAVVISLPPPAAPVLAESPVVLDSEPNYYVRALLDNPPSDPYFDQQWGLGVIGAPSAWAALPADTPPVPVAIIDSGICADHPDLNGRLLAGYDFVEGDTTPQDPLGHGCAVAGVLGASIDNGQGIAGVAPNVRLMPLRVLDADGIGTYADVAAAIIHAVDNGAQIINLSLGGEHESGLLADALAYAESHGVVVVAAAGNTAQEQVLYPAAYDSVIAVGAIDRRLQRSSFSAYGPQLGLLAPGQDILTTGSGGIYVTLSGTSMAAPHVSGAAALEMAFGRALVTDGGLLSLGDTPTPLPTPDTEEEIPPEHRDLYEKARQQGDISLIVALDAPYWPESQLTQPQAQAQRATIQQVRSSVIQSLQAHNATIAPRSTQWNIPYMVVEVDAEALRHLLQHPDVVGIDENIRLYPHIVRSIPFINADDAHQLGFEGSGVAVAILDTGIDPDHTFFGGRVVEQACFSNINPNPGNFTLCPNGMDWQIGPGAADVAGCPNEDMCRHGTHVAGIAAGNAPGEGSGVARDASIIAIQVFTGNVDCEIGIPDQQPCIFSYLGDQIDAMLYVLNLADTYDIAAVNMSLGSTATYTRPECEALDSTGIVRNTMNSLRAAGIAPVVSSGNSGATNGLSYPGCLSTAISVGSTGVDFSSGPMQDVVSNFSNSASFLDLLAPGGYIVSAYPGDYYTWMGGTSMAAPHVTGTWALLRQASPDLSVDGALAILKDTGVPVLDSRNGITKPRIDVYAALTEAMPVDLVVNTTSDTDDGFCSPAHCSLREAINQANTLTGTTQVIRFDIGAGGPQTIALAQPLPAITDPIIINGTTQPGYSGAPLIELDGSSAGANTIGLDILAGGSTVRGLVVNRFGGGGIRLAQGGDNVIDASYIGTKPDGTSAAPNLHGIIICSSDSNRIGGTIASDRNIISGNTQNGIHLCQLPNPFPPAVYNVIQGNYIGLNVTGSGALGNGRHGIYIEDASSTLISGNVISGNTQSGIEIVGLQAAAHVIQDNRIGPNAAGTAALASTNARGIHINGSSYNLIGGSAGIDGNLISGNRGRGILISGVAEGNIIRGNLFGTDYTGTQELAGPKSDNIYLELTVTGTLIGGMEAGDYNVLAGSTGYDPAIVLAGHANTVQGNYIGTNTSAVQMGNAGGGILVHGQQNMIGGPDEGAGNVIAYNNRYGVSIAPTPQAGVYGNAILGNSIYDNAYVSPLNAGLGIELMMDGVTPNDPGDADTGANHVQNFPELTSAEATINTLAVSGMLDSTPDTAFRVEFFLNATCDPSGYGEGQIFLGGLDDVLTDSEGSATFTADLYGGFSPGQQVTATATGPDGSTSEFSACHPVTQSTDTLLVNTASGVHDGVCDAHCSLPDALTVASGIPGQQTVLFNIPGTGPHAIQLTAQLPLLDDVIVDATSQPGYTPGGPRMIALDGAGAPASYGLRLGSDATVRGLSIHSFIFDGVFIDGDNNVLEGNYIGTDPTGTQALGMGGSGVVVARGHNNHIGGTTPDTGNVIVDNFWYGVELRWHSSGSFIQGNRIGVSAGGTALPNQQHGIMVRSEDNLIGGTEDTTPGGPCTGACNLISGNGADGIHAVDESSSYDTRNNIIQGNFIGTDASGTAALPNQGSGIALMQNAVDTLIGGPNPGEGNLISGSGGAGIAISATASSTIQGNTIGLNITGTAALGNTSHGISLTSGAASSIISHNLIAGNGGSGVFISGETSDSNVVHDNRIGTDTSGMIAIPNASHGVHISGGADNTRIGAVGQGNLIAGNGGSGVYIADSTTESTEVIDNIIGASSDTSAALGNTQHGVELVSSRADALIGNIISGNLGSGIAVQGVLHTVIQANLIGAGAVDSTESGPVPQNPLPNGGHGIWFISGSQTTTGGAGADEANVIAFNAGDGVYIEGAIKHTLYANIFVDNGGLGIDIAPDGINPNDAGDGDSGANDLQNYPVISSAAGTLTQLVVEGSLNSLANRAHRLEIFSSDACDASGYGEGRWFLGFADVTTNASGSASFSVSLPVVVSPGTVITMTATDSAGSTSEFSACAEVSRYITTPADFAAAVLTEADIELSWADASVDETHWLLERSPAGQEQWTEIASLNSDDSAGTGGLGIHHDTSFLCGVAYDYRLRAYNEPGGYYSLYATVSNIMLACPLLQPPADLALVPAPRAVTLNWTDTNITETSYRLSHSTDGGITWQFLADLPASSETYTHQGLLCTTQHSYRLRAVRDHDSAVSDHSAVVSASTEPCPLPVAPLSPTALALSPASIQFSWVTGAPGETSAFHLERSTDGVNWQPWTSVPASVTSATDTNLTCATTYHYRVRTYRAEDQSFSDYSAPANALTSACAAPVTHTVGLYKNGVWQFWDSNNTSQPVAVFEFGPAEAGWLPVVGDWDGSGADGIGLYKNGIWQLRSVTAAGAVESMFLFGPAESGWLPVVGDWDGDGVDGIGLYKNGLWLLRQTASEGPADLSFAFGPAQSGWLPLAGDWDASGTASVGLYKDGLWLLSNTLPALADFPPFSYGQAGQRPVVGDWNEDGSDTAGLFIDGLWQLRNSNSAGAGDLSFGIPGSSGWTPLAVYRGGIGGLSILAAPSPAPVTESPLPSPTPESTVTVTPAPSDGPEATDEPTADITPEATAEVTEEATEAATATTPPTAPPTVTPPPPPTATPAPPTDAPEITEEPPEATDAVQPE